jgi:hypothetical protein
MVKKDDIDNKYEFGAFIIKHWWKVLILIVASGVVITGFKCSWKNIAVEKTPVYRYQKVDK